MARVQDLLQKGHRNLDADGIGIILVGVR